METKKRIHPHLKSFFRTVLLAELAINDKHSWQENLMRSVQESILQRSGEIQTPEDLERIASEETEMAKKEVLTTIELVGHTLKQIPLELLKG